MKRIHHAIAGLLLAAGACGLAQAQTTPPEVAAHQRQELARGDPARWYQDDATTPEQLRNLRKEISAALQEATTACKRGPASERAGCMKEAQANYKHDMSHIQQLRVETRG
jgi:hypothetical protein